MRTGVQRPVPAGRRGGGPPTGQRPTGVTVPARYREQSRTGWYALAAFFALVALGIGGFLLFNTLASDDPPSSRQLPDYVGQRAVRRRRRPHRPRPHLHRSSRSRTTSFQDGIVHRTDPVGRAR